MPVDRFCRNVVGPPEWECEAMDSVCGYSVLTSAERVLSLSIALPTDKGLVRK